MKNKLLFYFIKTMFIIVGMMFLAGVIILITPFCFGLESPYKFFALIGWVILLTMGSSLIVWGLDLK